MYVRPRGVRTILIRPIIVLFSDRRRDRNDVTVAAVHDEIENNRKFASRKINQFRYFKFVSNKKIKPWPRAVSHTLMG